MLSGLGDTDSLQPLCDALWEATLENEDSSYLSLQRFYHQGYKKNANHIINNLDEEAMDKLVASMQQANDISKYTYNISQKIFPDKTNAEHLQFTLNVYSTEISSESELEEIKTFLKAVEEDCLQNPDNLKKENRLANLYRIFGNSRKTLSFIESKYAKNPNVTNARNLMNHYLFFDRYEDAAKIAASIDNSDRKDAIEDNLYNAVVLQRGGLEKESQALFDAAMPELLSRPISLMSISSLYYRVGLYDDAAKTLDTCFTLSDPNEEDYLVWTNLLLKGLSTYKKTKNYQKAALCGEALLLFELSSEMSNPNIAGRLSTNNSFFRYYTLRRDTNLNWIQHFAERGNTKAARALAREVAEETFGNASLADEFYPIMRSLGYNDILQDSIDKNMAHYRDLITNYPEAYMHYNGAAWLASRAVSHLEEAKGYITKALASSPISTAYLDTMAEVYFASGDRPGALEYSLRAWQDAPGGKDPLIKEQYYHFKNDPLPNQQ